MYSDLIGISRLRYFHLMRFNEVVQIRRKDSHIVYLLYCDMYGISRPVKLIGLRRDRSFAKGTSCSFGCSSCRYYNCLPCAFFAFFILLSFAKVTLRFFETWLDAFLVLLFGLAVVVLVILFLFKTVCCSLLVTHPDCSYQLGLKDSCCTTLKDGSCLTWNCGLTRPVFRLNASDIFLLFCGDLTK